MSEKAWQCSATSHPITIWERKKGDWCAAQHLYFVGLCKSAEDALNKLAEVKQGDAEAYARGEI